MKKLIQLIAIGHLCLLFTISASAQAPLEVECVGNQGIRITQDGSTTSFTAAVTTDGSVVGNTSNTPMDFMTNNLQRMTIGSNGKIGIGIASPQRRFHVSDPGVSGGPLTEVMMLHSASSKRPTLVFSEDGQGAMSIEYDGRLLGDDNKININDNDENPQFTFTMGGNMGIGTINPIAPLHIVNEGTSNVPNTCLLLESNTSNRPRISFSETSTGIEAMSLEYDGNGGASTNRMHIGSDTEGPIATFVRASKNVGIGTITPQKTLHIEGDINAALRITASGQPVFLDAWVNGSSASIGTSSNHALNFFTNNTTRMQIEENGNVGIGTVFPSHKLQVIGTISATQMLCNGTSLCSDARFKKGILPINNSMEKLSKLQGVNYFWDIEKFNEKGFSEEKQIGFVAQEIQNIFPELVYTDPEGYLSVDYTSLIPVLVEALKEQQDDFETFKEETNQRIAALEKSIKKVRKRNR